MARYAKIWRGIGPPGYAYAMKTFCCGDHAVSYIA